MLDITAKDMVCKKCLKRLAYELLGDYVLVPECGPCRLVALEEAFDRGFDDGFVTGRCKKGT